MKTRDFLIIGHPRGGTSYSSRLFKTFGFDVGHEHIHSTGISSWCFVTPDGYNAWGDCNKRNEYNFKWTFRAIRNPLSNINSLVKNNEDITSVQLFEKWSGFKLTEKDPLNRAVQRYLYWEDTIEYWNDYIDFTFRVEDQQKDLYNYLQLIKYEPYFHLGENEITEHIVSRNMNTRPKDKKYNLKDISEKYQEKIVKKMIKYGYSLES
jgi:hypothetical protein